MELTSILCMCRAFDFSIIAFRKLFLLAYLQCGCQTIAYYTGMFNFFNAPLGLLLARLFCRSALPPPVGPGYLLVLKRKTNAPQVLLAEHSLYFVIQFYPALSATIPDQTKIVFVFVSL